MPAYSQSTTKLALTSALSYLRDTSIAVRWSEPAHVAERHQ